MDGNLVALAAHRRLVLADISDAASPRFVGESRLLDSPIASVALQNGYAWGLSGLGPLYGFDVRQPAAPAIVSITNLPDTGPAYRLTSLAVVGDRLYVGVRSHIHLLDIHDKTHPRLVATFDMPANHMGQAAPMGLVAREDLVYAAAFFSDDDPGYLLAIDWSRPDAPIEAARVDVGWNPQFELALAGDWLIAERNYVEFYDVSDRHAIRLVASTRRDPPGGPSWDTLLPDIGDDVGTIAASGNDVWFVGYHAPSQAVRLTMGAVWPPVVAGQHEGLEGFHLAAGPDRAVLVRDNLLTELTVVTSTGDGIAPVGETTRLAATGSPILTSRRAYLIGGSGDRTEIVSVVDPARPKVIGSVPTGQVVYADDDWLMTVESPLATSHWDVRDPQNPRLITEHRSNWITVSDSVAHGDLVFIAGEGMCGESRCSGVHAVPASGSAPPSFWPLPSGRVLAHRVAAFDNHLVVGGGSGFHVLEVSADRPVVVGSGQFEQIDGQPDAFGVVDIAGGFGPHLVAAKYRTVEIHDLSDPTSPRLADVLERESYSAYWIDVQDNWIFQQDQGEMIVAELRAEPYDLVQVATFDWPAASIAVSGQLLAASSSVAGMRLYRAR